MELFKDRLILIRTTARYGRTEFATRLGIPMPSLANYELSLRSPMLDVAFNLFNAMRMTNVIKDDAPFSELWLWLCGGEVANFDINKYININPNALSVNAVGDSDLYYDFKCTGWVKDINKTLLYYKEIGGHFKQLDTISIFDGESIIGSGKLLTVPEISYGNNGLCQVQLDKEINLKKGGKYIIIRNIARGKCTRSYSMILTSLLKVWNKCFKTFEV